MNNMILKIKLEAPLCIAKKRAVGNEIECLDYIPGSTIRGAFASQFTPGTSDFELLFLNENVIWGNAYLNHSRPIPLTAVSCKYYPGFKTADHEKHGIKDRLHILAKKYIENIEFKDDEECKLCKSVFEKINGFYLQYDSDTYSLQTPSKRLIMQTAISEISETASEGNLFTLEVLNECISSEIDSFIPQTFYAEIKSTDADALTKIKNNLDVERLGLGKSRGLGLIKCIVDGIITSNFPTTNLASRMETFNKNVNCPGFLFSITLQSDVILFDNLLRYKTYLTPDDLLPYTVTEDEKLLLKSFVNIPAVMQQTQIFGWNTAWQLPKETEIGIQKGSVFLFYSKSDLNNLQKSLLTDILSRIEEKGIGSRRSEGFGQVSICDEFHKKGVK